MFLINVKRFFNLLPCIYLKGNTMKAHLFLFTAIVLITGAFIFFQGCAGCPTCSKETNSMEKTAYHLKTEELKAMMDSEKNITILDARSSVDSKIPGATVLPAGSPDNRILKALPDKNAEIVTYCSSVSCGASNKLASQLKQLGYTNVREYPEGIKGWMESGNRTEKAGE